MSLLKRIFSRENVFALLLCLIILGVIIVTADASPQWIYQGFKQPPRWHLSLGGRARRGMIKRDKHHVYSGNSFTGRGSKPCMSSASPKVS